MILWLRPLGRVLTLVLAAAVLAWLTARHVRPASKATEPPGPRQIIMGQRLTQAVPDRLAGLPLLTVLRAAAARAGLASLAGDLPLLRVSGARFAVPPDHVTLWVGDALGAAQAGAMVDSLWVRFPRGGPPSSRAVDSVPGAARQALPSDSLAWFAVGPRFFLLLGSPDRVDSAVAQLRSARGRHDPEPQIPPSQDLQRTGDRR